MPWREVEKKGRISALPSLQKREGRELRWEEKERGGPHLYWVYTRTDEGEGWEVAKREKRGGEKPYATFW